MKKWLALFCIVLSLPAFAAKKTVRNADDLFIAAETKSAKELRKLLKGDSDRANAIRGDEEETLLMAAVAADRDNAIIKELLNAGAEIDSQTQSGKTAFMLACQYQSHEDVIKTLLTNIGILKAQKRKLILMEDDDGKTAFDYVLKNPNKDAILEILTKYAENPNGAAKATDAPTTDGGEEVETALMQALKIDANLARIYDILNNGADVTTATVSGKTALMYACQYESHENVIVTMVERTSALKSQQTDFILSSDNDGKTAFDYALLNADPPWVIDILERYLPNPNPVVYVSTTRLAKLEEEAAAEVELPEIEPWTPTYLLDYAELDSETVITEPDYVDVESFKRTFIAEPDKKDREGRTLLMKAARDGNLELMEDLFYSEADVQLKDNDGWTALMFAARFQEDTEVLRRLLKAGANQLARNNYGLTALALAAGFSDNPDVVSLLLESRSVAEKEIRETFIYAITAGASTDILALFLEKGISLNAPYNGKTPLMYAAETNTNTRLISWLLKHGAKATYKTTSGMTAFDFARRNSQLPHNEVYWSLNTLTTGGN